MVHREAILQSDACGCYYCLARFAPAEIVAWTDVDEQGVGQTALCPRCGVDSVVGFGGNGHALLADEWLRTLHAQAFG